MPYAIMHPTGFSTVFILATLSLNIANAGLVLDEFSTRVMENMISCPCSPTMRKYTKPHNFTRAVREYNNMLHLVETPKVMSVLHKYHDNVIEAFSLCAAQFGHELCVNMDADLRRDLRCTVQVCIFDKYTGKNLERSPNLEGFKFLKPCNAVPEYGSRGDGGQGQTAHYRHVHVNHTSGSSAYSATVHRQYPSSTEEKKDGGRPKTIPRVFKALPASPMSSEPNENGDVFIRVKPKSVSQMSAVQATSSPSTSQEKRSAGHLKEPTAKTSAETAPKVLSNGHPRGRKSFAQITIPMPSKIPASPRHEKAYSQMTAEDAKMSEGCVAVEHLHGYALQHKKNLRRNVLCSKGFCATPHHAIIVDGKITSMKKMCLEWVCSTESKMVNNLNLFANRRVNAGNGIVITPYDVRYPRFFAWFAQMFTTIFA